MWPAADLREVRVFLVLAEELHSGHTGERLGLTPSRVSQTIRTLETRLGGTLFDRTSRRVRLTPLGERLRGRIAPSYEQLERAFHDARNSATGIAGRLSIGMYARMSGGPHWSKIVERFTVRHPDCALDLHDTGLERNYLDQLRAGDVDLLAVRLPVSDPDMTVGPVLSHEPRVLIVASHDPLAQRESVSYEELADRELSDVPAFPREMMDAFIPPFTPAGKPIRRIANRSLEDELLRLAVGTQVHPTVPSFLDHAGLRDVVAVPITDLPPSETALVWLTTNHSPKIQAFARAATDVLEHTDLGLQRGGRPE